MLSEGETEITSRPLTLSIPATFIATSFSTAEQAVSYILLIYSRRGPVTQSGCGAVRAGNSRAHRIGKGGAGSSSSSARSEEHTSELQSRENLVCRLLLEQKN